MKKTFLLLVALVATVVGASAQGQTATLQQGDKMTPFYGPDAFVQAYNAAPQKGGVITLSAGYFNPVDSITKQVTIIGNGCVDHDGTNQTYIYWKMIKGYDSAASLVINANNVKIEGVCCGNSVYIRNVSNSIFRNCYISGGIYGTHTHKNTVIDQCYINDLYALARAENMCIKNSIIKGHLYGGFNTTGYYAQSTTSNPAYFSNCLIYKWYDIVQVEANYYKEKYYSVYGTFKNCILGQRNYSYNWTSTSNENYWQLFNIASYNPSGEYYNNVFFLYPYKYEKNASGNWVEEEFEEMKTKEMNFTVTESQTKKGNTSSTWAALFNDDATNWWEKIKSDIPFKGDDGTVVGPYGGTGFSINPSIPRIVESKIDSNTDADGKLNVKIKVEVNQ